MTPDIINSIFEFVAAGSVLISVRQILKDREVKGVAWLGCLFMPVWSFWNIYFYASLAQGWSLLAALSMSVAETIYVILLIYYSHNEWRIPMTQEEIEGICEIWTQLPNLRPGLKVPRMVQLSPEQVEEIKAILIKELGE